LGILQVAAQVLEFATHQNGFPDDSTKSLSKSISVTGSTSMLSASVGLDSCQRISADSSNAKSVNLRNKAEYAAVRHPRKFRIKRKGRLRRDYAFALFSIFCVIPCFAGKIPAISNFCVTFDKQAFSLKGCWRGPSPAPGGVNRFSPWEAGAWFWCCE
jgi:hypothetical protein